LADADDSDTATVTFQQLLLAQGLAEYGALNSFAGVVQHASTVVDDWVGGVDSRVWMVCGVLAVLWLGSRAFRSR